MRFAGDGLRADGRVNWVNHTLTTLEFEEVEALETDGFGPGPADPGHAVVEQWPRREPLLSLSFRPRSGGLVPGPPRSTGKEV